MLVKIDGSLFEKAMLYSIEKHSGQTRKGNGMPYFIHPFNVMKRIFDNKESKNMYMLGIACLLHDVLEDCYDTPEERLEGLLEMVKIFGPQIAGIVDELTLDKEQYAIIGKKEYLAQELNEMSSYALAIKLCDRLENICDTKHMDHKFKRYYVEQTLYILAKLDRRLTPTHENLVELIATHCFNYQQEADNMINSIREAYNSLESEEEKEEYAKNLKTDDKDLFFKTYKDKLSFLNKDTA